jgi:hypothetical protein
MGGRGRQAWFKSLLSTGFSMKLGQMVLGSQSLRQLSA